MTARDLWLFFEKNTDCKKMAPGPGSSGSSASKVGLACAVGSDGAGIELDENHFGCHFATYHYHKQGPFSTALMNLRLGHHLPNKRILLHILVSCCKRIRAWLAFFPLPTLLWAPVHFGIHLHLEVRFSLSRRRGGQLLLWGHVGNLSQ